MRFRCKKCGTCCRNLLEGYGFGIFGLMLLPNEKHLFSPGTVYPYIGLGTRGSRRRPARVVSYQLALETCPHLTEENLCAIYGKRPMACRSFPLEFGQVDIVGPRIFLSEKCREVDAVKDEVRTLNSDQSEAYVDEETAEAHREVLRYIAKNMMQARSPHMWMYALDKQKWINYLEIAMGGEP